jgi:hypothetical protein
VHHLQLPMAPIAMTLIDEYSMNIEYRMIGLGLGYATWHGEGWVEVIYLISKVYNMNLSN